MRLFAPGLKTRFGATQNPEEPPGPGPRTFMSRRTGLCIGVALVGQPAVGGDDEVVVRLGAAGARQRRRRRGRRARVGAAPGRQLGRRRLATHETGSDGQAEEHQRAHASRSNKIEENKSIKTPETPRKARFRSRASAPQSVVLREGEPRFARDVTNARQSTVVFTPQNGVLGPTRAGSAAGRVEAGEQAVDADGGRVLRDATARQVA
jgi:hypothetical protein